MAFSDENAPSEGPVYPAVSRPESAAGAEPPGGARPHVFLLCDKHGWEQIGPIIRRLAVGLIDETVTVSLICDHDCPASVSLPGLRGTYNLQKYGYLDVFRPQRRYGQLLEFAQKSPPSFIHATSLSSLETALELKQLLHVPLLASADAAAGASLDLLGEILSEECRAVAMSEPIRQALVQRAAGRAETVQVVRPGVHVQERQRPPFEPGSPISILVLEPVVRSSAMEAMLRAVAQLLQNGINVMLFFIDSGPGETYLRKVALRLQVHEHITFTGKFMRWPQTLGAADIVVLPHAQPQLQVYPLETMASATLMVAAKGHCYDTIVDGRTGLEFDPDREDDLAAKLVGILQDPQKARALAYAAQDKIRRDHSVSHMISGYMGVYEKMHRVGAGSRPGARFGM